MSAVKKLSIEEAVDNVLADYGQPQCAPVIQSRESSSFNRFRTALAAGAMALIAGMAPNSVQAQGPTTEKPNFRPTVFTRLGIQSISTTSSTSEAGDSFIFGTTLPAYPDAPGWVDAPSAQLNIGMIGTNGTEVDIQLGQGFTVKANKYFDITSYLGAGFAQFGVGLDSEDAQYIPAGYGTASLNLNARLPVSDGVQLFASPGCGVKAYTNEVHFNYEDLPRTQFQPAIGGALGLSVDVNSRVNMTLSAGMFYYPTDRAENRVWGDTALTVTIKP